MTYCSYIRLSFTQRIYDESIHGFGLFHLHSRYIVQILVHSHFDLVSSPLALEATEPVSEPVTQMVVELINIHLISVQQKRLKYGSEEKGSSLCRCSILLGFIMSKKQERLRSELLSEDKITNLLGFLT